MVCLWDLCKMMMILKENGAAYCCGGLEVGQLILSVDGTKVEGLQHQDVARLIAESFARRDRSDIEFTVKISKRIYRVLGLIQIILGCGSEKKQHGTETDCPDLP